MIFKRYTYKDFDQDTEKLAGLIRQIAEAEGKRFTKIYGIPRGGLMVAVRLSHLLGLPLVLREEEIDQNTIVAEDIVHTGETHKRLTKRINLRHFLVAAIFFVHEAEGLWDAVYVHSLKDNRDVWVWFPWETEQSTRL